VELDSRFAPAWARLGRCHRIVGKYIEADPGSEARAEDAFRRALALNPRLSLAHKYYANLEADIGRASSALLRLLGEASRHGNDPELFAGLVHACRYCGLYDESIAAHAEARRLDPHAATGVDQTLLMAGEVDRIAGIDGHQAGGGDDGIRVIALGLAGRLDEARARLASMRQVSRIPLFEGWIEYLGAWLDRRVDVIGAGLHDSIASLKINDDPEAIFQQAWIECDLGRHEEALPDLEQAVAKGYFVATTLARSRQFDPLRGHPRFQALLAQAEAGRARALAAFREAGGARLIGAAAA
jgi:eukaryotic-like serine/threonine-protein kinase